MSCRYFFKVFDIEQEGKLTGTVISKWCQTVFEHIQSMRLADEDHDPENMCRKLQA